MRKFLFVSLLVGGFIAGSARANGMHVGNGGDAIVCGAPPQQKAVFLDFWSLSQTEIYRKFIGPQLAAWPAESPAELEDARSEYYRRLTLPLRQVSDFQQKFERAEMHPLWKLWAVEARFSLRDLPDENFYAQLPPGCSLRQAVVRQGDNFAYDPSVLALLERSESPGQMAYLQFHEAIAKLFYDHGLRDTTKTRWFLHEYVVLLWSLGYLTHPGEPLNRESLTFVRILLWRAGLVQELDPAGAAPGPKP